MTVYHVEAGGEIPPAEALAAGDEVLLQRGGAWNEGVTIRASDTKLGAFGEGPLPQLRPIKHGIEVNGNGNLIRDIEIVGGISGVRFWGQGNSLRRCYIHDIASPDQAGVAVWLLNTGNEVAYCHIANCTHPHDEWGCDGGAFEWFWYGDACHVHHNLVVGNCGVLEVGTYEGQGSAHNVVVEHNLCINNGAFSWIHQGDSQFATDVDNFQIRYNTIVELGDHRHAIFGGDNTGVELWQNLIFLPTMGYVAIPGSDDMALVDRITTIEDIIIQLQAQVAQLRLEAQEADDVIDAAKDLLDVAADAIEVDIDA